MRARLAAMRFDWSRASLSMDLPVFLYFHTTGLKFLFRQGRCLGELSIWLQICRLQTTKIEPYGLLFCLDLVKVDHQGLLLVICIHYPIISNPLAVRPTTS